MGGTVRASSRVVTHELMPDAVFRHHVVPYLSTPLKKNVREVARGDYVYHFETKWEGQGRVLSIFEEAHKVAELYVGLASVSACNRHYRDQLKSIKKQLGDRIIHLLDSLPVLDSLPETRDRPLFIINDAIQCGSYLRALKIFFHYKPQALNCAPFATPLHYAVDMRVIRSISFIDSILQIDKKQVQKGNQSLLLVQCGENLVLEDMLLIKHSIARDPDHRLYGQLVKEDVQVKGLLAKHACEIGIEDKLIKHAEHRAVIGRTRRIDFHEEDLAQVRDLITKAKRELAVSKLLAPIPVKTHPDIRVDIPKKVETIPEKKPASFCSRIWKAIVYTGTCQWAGDFIKFLKRIFR